MRDLTEKKPSVTHDVYPLRPLATLYHYLKYIHKVMIEYEASLSMIFRRGSPLGILQPDEIA